MEVSHILPNQIDMIRTHLLRHVDRTIGRTEYRRRYPQLYAEIEEALREHEGAFFVAISSNGSLSGYMSIRARSEQGQRNAELTHVFVWARYRRQGVGTLLLRESLAWAKRRRIETVRVLVSAKNEPARDFYKSHCFRTRTLEMELELEEASMSSQIGGGVLSLLIGYISAVGPLLWIAGIAVVVGIVVVIANE